MAGLSALLHHQQQQGAATPTHLSPGHDGLKSNVTTTTITSPPGDTSLLAQLTSNPIFVGGFGIIGLTASAALLRKSLVTLTTLLRRQLLVDLEIPSKDKSYQWFLHWMSTHQRQQLPQTAAAYSNKTGLTRRGRRSILSYITPRVHHLAVETIYAQLPGGSISTKFTLVPGPGKHLLNYHNTLIQVTRERDIKSLDLQTGSPFETVKLTTLYRDRHVFSQLLSEAQSLAQTLTQGKTVIYTSWGSDWKEFGSPKRKRPLESVILDRGVKESLVKDVKDFLASSSWYYDRGIPYRRGYLLYGPPGSGKSSFINALAGELDYNICVLNLSERGLTDDRLNHLLTNLPERSIALLEDVDAAFGKHNSRVQTAEDGYRGANVTFSGLLNALDGVASGEERIIVLTTNHRDRLDPALVRPGRVDREVYIGWASEAQVREMWRRFYGGECKKGEEEIVEILKGVGVLEGGKEVGRGEEAERVQMEGEEKWGRGISTAQLQGVFVYNKGDPQGAVELLRKMVSESLGTVGKEVR
ncbi:BCS1 N terminal-domain-containing protein [Terfezia claveryi]|nr:BCS1 N terminal-domain-containing protein [Terfezia claveryi]